MRVLFFIGSLLFVVGLFILLSDTGHRHGKSLLNVSYDPTRELYQDINQVFVKEWRKTSGESVTIRQSHGGSGQQARAVIDGLDADVVTLALAPDIDKIAQITGKLPLDWQSRLPFNSAPYQSTVVFLVRKGNPKGIHDWNDLVQTGVHVITANPKTSGGARWNFLAAWGSALKRSGGDEEYARQFVTDLFKSVPVFDVGSRGSTTTFAQRQIGDVLITWENEAFLALQEFGSDKLEMVVPPMSILAEPPVALVDANAQAHGNVLLAEGYLNFLYSPEAQRLIAKHFYRPCKPEYAHAADLARFQPVEFFTVDELFGGWKVAHVQFFAEGGEVDKMFAPKQ